MIRVASPQPYHSMARLGRRRRGRTGRAVAPRAVAGTGPQGAADTGRADGDPRRSRRGIPALPFCKWTVIAKRPRKSAYPKSVARLGDHLRQRRLNLNLLQREAAARVGVSPTTFFNWERGRSEPSSLALPAVIRFLEYDPRSATEGVGQRLQYWRKGRGLSQENLACRLGVDPGTLSRWERGLRLPTGEHHARVLRVLEDRAP